MKRILLIGVSFWITAGLKADATLDRILNSIHGTSTPYCDLVTLGILNMATSDQQDKICNACTDWLCSGNPYEYGWVCNSCKCHQGNRQACQQLSLECKHDQQACQQLKCHQGNAQACEKPCDQGNMQACQILCGHNNQQAFQKTFKLLK